MSDEQGDAVEAPDAADEASNTGKSTSADESTDDFYEAVEESDLEVEEAIDADEIKRRIDDGDLEEVAQEIATLQERIGDLELRLEEVESERDDLESRLKRKQAEFQNYKKRQKKRREQERARATEALVERLLEVRDNLDRALQQSDDADIREGVEATFRQLEEILREEDVEPIEPESGDEIDPNRHEVLLRVESDEPAGSVAAIHRPGYEMAGKVLRPAQVTVSDGDSTDSDEQSDDDSKSA